MSEKYLIFFSFFGFVVAGCTIFIAWRLRTLNALKAEAEERAVGAFEDMNRLTKQLRERSKSGPVEITATGERLQHMYPGVKRPPGDPDSP